MTNRLDQLEKAGLVKRLPDLDDRRALHVELTDKGHKLWADSLSAQAEKEARARRCARRARAGAAEQAAPKGSLGFRGGLVSAGGDAAGRKREWGPWR